MEITKHMEQYRKDLMLKNYSQNTIENYVSQVTGFLHHFNGKFSDASRINEQSIKDWLMLAKSINGRKHRIAAVKSFYHLTIQQPLKFKHIEYPRKMNLLRLPDSMKKYYLIYLSSLKNPDYGVQIH